MSRLASPRAAAPALPRAAPPASPRAAPPANMSALAFPGAAAPASPRAAAPAAPRAPSPPNVSPLASPRPPAPAPTRATGPRAIPHSEMDQAAIREVLQMDDAARGVVPQQRHGPAQHRQICADEEYARRLSADMQRDEEYARRMSTAMQRDEEHARRISADMQRDEEYAQRLQYVEDQHLAHQLSLRIWDAATCLTHPLWGPVEFDALEVDESWMKNKKKQVTLSCLFSLCPCCMFTAAWSLRNRMQIKDGATHRDIRIGYRRMLLSWSFLLAIPQLLSVIFQQVVGYTWVAEDGVDFNGDYQHSSMVHQFDAEGAKNAAKIIYGNEWWRLITPVFLHGGWVHLLGNLAVQLRAGMMLEAIWGRHVWLLIYLASGIMGNVWSCIANPNTLSIGSSSSLSGIVGAWPVFIAITWNQTTPNDRKQRDREMLCVIVALILLIAFSFMPMVDWAAHLGGLAAGVTVSATCFARKLQTPSWSIATGVVGALSCLSLFVVSTGYMFTSVKPDELLLEL